MLIVPALIAVGWYGARQSAIATRIAGLFLAGFGLFLLISLAATGLLADPASLHRWIGHGYFIYLWLGVPLTIGALLQRSGRGRRVPAMVASVALGLGVAAGFVANVTGYLPQADDRSLEPETYHRFLLLHTLILPVVLLVVQGVWLAAFWPKNVRESGAHENS